MNQQRALLLLCSIFLLSVAEAQTVTKYLVKLKNKGSNPYSLSNPSPYLTQRAIDRRTRYSIPLDSTDLPVTPSYINQIKNVPNVSVLNASKWLNQVAIQTTDANALATINGFPFVQSVSQISFRLGNVGGAPTRDKFKQPKGEASAAKETGIMSDYFNYGQSFAQVHIHNGEFLHNIGLRGQNMLLCMLDAGFKNFLTVPVLDSVRNNGQILGIYDFVARDSSVNEDDSHGEECFSTIAANSPGQMVGTAPKAKFYLFRTEDAATETPIEEHYWVCGAERVDSLGGDVISSSLGYNTFDAPFGGHTYADMNGNTTMAAIGADLAAKKGILVVNAAGNEGSSSWGHIITPADGDSIMAVGAVNTSGVPANFTSRGPSSDGQVKPDVASVGVNTIIQYPNGTIAGGNGTSFATPNMAGLTTCLWQGFPEFNNMDIIQALRTAGSRANNPNDTIGYGIPNVKLALLNLTIAFSNASGTVGNCKTTINWTSKDVNSMKYEIERKAPGQINFVKIGELQGTGGSVFSTQSYSYADSLINVDPGTITYRLREIIDTNSATFMAGYIDTVAVTLGSACIATGFPPINTDNGIVLIPNPANDIVYIKVRVPDSILNLQIRITDAVGKLVSSVDRSKPYGTVVIPFDISNYAIGEYFVNVYSNGKLLATKKLIKAVK